MCDKKAPDKVKGKLYKSVVRPALLYGMETVAVTKAQESKMEVAEMRMLRFSLGLTRLDQVRNETVRNRLNVGKLSDKLRESRLRWYGHVQRREEAYVGKRVMSLTVGRRRRGRPRRRWKECIAEDSRAAGVREEDMVDSSK